MTNVYSQEQVDALIAEAVGQARVAASQTIGHAPEDTHMETSSMLDHSETGEDSNITIYHELHESTIALINNNFNMTPATLHHATRDVLYYTHQQLQLLEMCIPFFKDNKSRTLTVGCLVTFAMAQFDCFNKVTNACAHALTRTLQDGSKDETLENLAIATTISAASARHLQNDLLAIIGEIAKLNVSQLRLLLPHLGDNKQPSITEGFSEQWEAIKKSHPKRFAGQSSQSFQLRGGYRPPFRGGYQGNSQWNGHRGRGGFHSSNRGNYCGQLWHANSQYQSQYGNQSSSSNPNAGTSSNAGQQ